jgi:hypothetical protein
MKLTTMEWLTLENAIAENFRVHGAPPQYLEFPADMKRLFAEIPTAPHFEEPGLIPGPSYQWYGRSGDRPLILECEQEPHDNHGRAFVHTSYLQRQDQMGDWTVLTELSDLPSSICVARPTFILSRSTMPEYVVFRSNPAGWDSVVYNASSRRDAENLLSFLKRDTLNENCFIGQPEPEGLWSAIRTVEGEEEVLCTYPTPSGALSVACRLSDEMPSELLVIKDRSGANPQQYFVSAGRVIDSAPRSH